MNCYPSLVKQVFRDYFMFFLLLLVRMPSVARGRLGLSRGILYFLRYSCSLLLLLNLLQFLVQILFCQVIDLCWMRLLVTVGGRIRTVFGRSVSSACFATIRVSLLLQCLDISSISVPSRKLIEAYSILI